MLVVACTVGLSVGVVAIAVSLDSTTVPPQVVLTGSADASTQEITIAHSGGERLDITALSLVVSIDGVELAHQPPVPFFSTVGFMPGPTGAFNVASEPTLHAGESASFRLASSNEPTLERGSVVQIRVFYDGAPLVTLEFAVD